MLKFSYSEKDKFLVRNKSQIEIKIKVSNILLSWLFIQQNFSINLNKYYLIGNINNFLSNLIISLLILLKRDKIKMNLNDYTKTCQTLFKQFIKLSSNLYSFINLLQKNSESTLLVKFYRRYYILSLIVFNINLNDQLQDQYKNILYQKFIQYPYYRILPYVYDYRNYNYIYSFSKIKNFCFITGRSRAVVRAFKLSRFKIRDYNKLGLFIGLVKSSW